MSQAPPSRVVPVVASSHRAKLALMLDPSQIAPDTLRPLSRREYERMVALGMFEDERVELLEGVIVQTSPQGTKHSAVIQRLTHLLVQTLGARAAIRIQSPFAASDGSEPEPAVAVVPPQDYDDEHPSTAYLIIEVAETSLAKDRGVKAKLYAANGAPEYWIVNTVDNLIEVHTEIISGSYTRAQPYRKGDAITLQRFPGVQLNVDDILR